jgi:hypothetical protein
MNSNTQRVCKWTRDDELNLICYLITRPNVFRTIFFTIENLQLRGQFETLNRLMNAVIDYAFTLGLSDYEVYEFFYMLHRS